MEVNMVKTVRILGVNYKVQTNVPVSKDIGLTNRFGYCAYMNHRIVVADLNTIDGWAEESEEVKQAQIKATLRHEVIHAFLHESGLSGSSVTDVPWAINEEMVDWIALQFPKISKVFKELGCEGE
jgi:hypothetical protein